MSTEEDIENVKNHLEAAKIATAKLEEYLKNNPGDELAINTLSKIVFTQLFLDSVLLGNEKPDVLKKQMIKMRIPISTQLEKTLNAAVKWNEARMELNEARGMEASVDKVAALTAKVEEELLALRKEQREIVAPPPVAPTAVSDGGKKTRKHRKYRRKTRKQKKIKKSEKHKKKSKKHKKKSEKHKKKSKKRAFYERAEL